MKIAPTHESAEWTPEVVNLYANRPSQQQFTMVILETAEIAFRQLVF